MFNYFEIQTLGPNADLSLKKYCQCNVNAETTVWNVFNGLKFNAYVF